MIETLKNIVTSIDKDSRSRGAYWLGLADGVLVTLIALAMAYWVTL